MSDFVPRDDCPAEGGEIESAEEFAERLAFQFAAVNRGTGSVVQLIEADRAAVERRALGAPNMEKALALLPTGFVVMTAKRASELSQRRFTEQDMLEFARYCWDGLDIRKELEEYLARRAAETEEET